MTNYNERLDEVLGRYGMYAVLKDANRFDDATMEHEFPAEVGLDKAKQALTSLIKELVAEAKPINEQGEIDIDVPAYNDGYYSGANNTLEKFEQNLLKALEEI